MSDKKEIDEADAIISELADVVVWMSGSYDFAPEGKAGGGWADFGLPRLNRALHYLNKKGKPLDDPERAVPSGRDADRDIKPEKST